ncbi:hypothetical protein MRX96_020081 [Rhipicephalus microplus]
MRRTGSHESSSFEEMLKNRERKTDVVSTRRLSSLLDTPQGLPASASKHSPLGETLGPQTKGLLERDTSSSELVPRISPNLPVPATRSYHNLTSTTHEVRFAHPDASKDQRETVAQRPLIYQNQTSRSSPGVTADKPVFLKYFAKRLSNDYAHAERSQKSVSQVPAEEQCTKASSGHEAAPNVERSDFVRSSAIVASSPRPLMHLESSGVTAVPSPGIFQNDSREQEEVPLGESLTFGEPGSSHTFKIHRNCEKDTRAPLKTATTWHDSSLGGSASVSLKSAAAPAKPVSGQVLEPKDNRDKFRLENYVSTEAIGAEGVRSSETRTSRSRESVLWQKKAVFGENKNVSRGDLSESTELSSHTTASQQRTTYRPSEVRLPNSQRVASREHKESNLSFERSGDTSSENDERLAKRKSLQQTSEGSLIRQASRTAAQTPRQAQVPATANDVPVNVYTPMSVVKEYLLYPVSVCLAFILVTVVTLLLFPEYVPSFWHEIKARAPKGRSSVTCSSMACLQNALYLNALVSWDREKPCNDFHSFVCLRWMNSFFSPFENSVSANDDFVAFLEQRIHKTLQENAWNSKTVRPLKDLYDKCNNYAVIEESGWAPFRNLLSDLSLSEFPLTSRTASNLSAWRIAAELVRETGTVALLSIGVAFHPVFAAIDIVSIGPPQLIARKSVRFEEAVDLYATVIFWVTHLSEGRSFPTSLAAATQKFAGNVERFAHLGTKESTTKVENLDTRSTLLKFVSDVLSGLQVSFFSLATPAILIRSPDVVDDIVNLVERTETHVVINYLVLRLVIQVAPFLPYSGLHDVNGALVYGKRTTRAPRSRLCLRAAERALFPAVYIHLLTETKLKTFEPTLVNFVPPCRRRVQRGGRRVATF